MGCGLARSDFRREVSVVLMLHPPESCVACKPSLTKATNQPGAMDAHILDRNVAAVNCGLARTR